MKKKEEKKLPKGITYREKDGRYMGRFMYHGKPFTVYGKTIKETQKKLEDLRYEVVHNIYFKPENITFSTWFDIWIEDYKKPSVKIGTVEVYRLSYDLYIKNVFGDMYLNDIRTEHIQRFYKKMAEKYSRNTLEICRAILNGAFKQAVRNEMIQKNPVLYTFLPNGKQQKKVRVMTKEEQDIFMKYAEKTVFSPLFEIALSTGMRSGEIRGLRWTDLDFHKKVIHISSTIVYIKKEYHLVSPKTVSSERDIPMLENVFSLLRKQRKKQCKDRLLMGEYWKPLEGMDDLVFTSLEGKPISNDKFKQEIMKVVRKIRKDGIAFDSITPHTFRHTFATRSIEKGIPPKVLQEILGHKELATTMDTYAHVLPDTKASEMQKLADLFG